jgi:hypothetical protein
VKEPSVKKHGGQKGKILLEACEVSRDFRIRVSDRHDPIEIKNLIQVWTVEELPHEGDNVQDDDEDINSRKVLWANGISNGNHDGSNILCLLFEYKKNQGK